jgi:serine/threonine protein kinase
MESSVPTGRHTPTVPHLAHLLLGQILVDHHRLTPEAVDAALRQQDAEERENGETRFVGEILVERRMATREQVAQALEYQRQQFALAMVGPYRLQSLLGRGGAGTVYRAVQIGGKGDGAAVALKLLPQRRPGDVDALARFQREAQAGVGLDHPHIVRTLDFGTTRDSYWLVCELMPGGTLVDRLRRKGPLEEGEALRLGVAMLQALDHAWARGLVHRDIKPANILYDAHDHPRLADLGLAQAILPPDDGPRDRTAGTPAFIAPEQAMGQERNDVRADLYSLGATLFFALTGGAPFSGANPLEVINQHLNVAPAAVDQVNPAVSGHCAAVVRKLMAKRVEDRYASPAEAIADVRRVQAGERPLAIALTAEKAFAPLKVQVQTRGGDSRTGSPSGTTRSAPTANSTAVPTPRSNRAQQRPAGSRSQDLARHAREQGAERKARGPATRKEPETDQVSRGARARPAAEARGQGGSRARPAARHPMGMLIAAGGIIVVGLGILAFVVLRPGVPTPPPVAVAEAEPAPAPATITVVDLLPKLDQTLLQREDWLQRDGGLLSPRGAQRLLPLPWLPPAEYDLVCSFKRLYPSGSLSLLFDIGGRQASLVLSGDSDLRMGFELVDGEPVEENGTQRILAEPLTPARRVTVTLRVRRDGLTALLGSKEICHLATTGSNLKLEPGWALPKGHLLGVGTRTTQVAIYKLAISEISGSGSAVAGH